MNRLSQIDEDSRVNELVKPELNGHLTEPALSDHKSILKLEQETDQSKAAATTIPEMKVESEPKSLAV